MFTGLIECTGCVRGLQRSADRAVLEVQAPLHDAGIRIGDSIAVNGACLTVTTLRGDLFSFDVSPETVSRTSLSSLQTGSQVNIERALSFGGRLDGHLVTGHIDCQGRLESRTQQGNAVLLKFSLPAEYGCLLVAKGSVAVDGISLTVNSVTDTEFSISVIPHTLAKTTLALLSVGKQVNIETDIIGKYVARLVAPHAVRGGLTLEKLMQNGFL